MDIRRHKDGKHQCFGSFDSHRNNKARLGFYASGLWGCQEKTPCQVVIGVVHSWNTSYIGQAECSLYRHTLGTNHTVQYIHTIHTYIVYRYMHIHTYTYIHILLNDLIATYIHTYIHTYIYLNKISTEVFPYDYCTDTHCTLLCIDHYSTIDKQVGKTVHIVGNSYHGRKVCNNTVIVVHIHVYVYVHIHTCIHTYIHT